MSAEESAVEVAEFQATEAQETEKICVILTPFGGWHDTYCREIFEPAILAAHLTPWRADDVYRSSLIIDDVWTFITRSKVVLAELTGRNPNVLYELGLAHAIPKPAILVTQSKEDVPSDLRHIRWIEYNTRRPKWDVLLGETITRYIGETLEAPATSVLPSFLKAVEPQDEMAVTPQEKELRQLRQDVDHLKREIWSIGQARLSFESGALFIHSAKYGSLDTYWDVGSIVESQVRGNRLTLPVANDVFGGDPTPGKRKALVVEYSYANGPLRTIAVRERDILLLPET